MIKYNLLLYLISPYLLFSVIFDGIRKKSGFKFILQRLGLLPIKRLSNTIWLHAASIGETKLAILLYKKLKSLDSSYNFLITTSSLEITFDTCSGLYLFNSFIEGKLVDKLYK